jgi:hypothetical protein
VKPPSPGTVATPIAAALAGALAFLCAAAAGAADDAGRDTLTAEEVAEGWVALFDGATTRGWVVEGDVRVADGQMILSGPARAVPTAAVGQNFAVRLEYRAAGPTPPAALLGWGSRLGGKVQSPQRLEALSGSLSEWVDATFTFRYDAKRERDNWSVTCVYRQPGDPAMWRSTDFVGSTRGTGTFAMEVPAGSKLYVRKARLKPEPASYGWLWPYAAAAGALLVAGMSLAGILYFRRRRRTRVKGSA